MKVYITGIIALNRYGYDWHSLSVDLNKRYTDNVKSWSDYGIKDNKPTPVRAYLDYLYNAIVNERFVPNLKPDDFSFSDDEIDKIKEKVDTILTDAIEDIKDDFLSVLLEKYKRYLNGGSYEFFGETINRRRYKRRENKKAYRKDETSIENFV